METRLTTVSALKVGGYVVFNGAACVIKSIQTSKPGKHGHSKCRIEAVGIKDGKKVITVMPAHDKIDIPIVEKKAAQILSIAQDKANVMDMESYETFDLPIPEDMKGQVSEGQQVIYWIVLGEKIMKQIK